MRTALLLLSIAGSICAAKNGSSPKPASSQETVTLTIAGNGSVVNSLYTIPAAELRSQQKYPSRFPLKELSRFTADEIYGSFPLSGSPVTVRMNRTGYISLSVKSSCTDPRAALKQAKEAADSAKILFLQKNGYVETDRGITENLAVHAAESAPFLSDLVNALGGKGSSPREFSDRALRFVQKIPYRSDRFYKKPLAFLAEGSGECGEKTALYLALMKNAWPETKTAAVIIRKHAFAAADLERERGDRTIRIGKERWVAAEPVGPRLVPTGVTGYRSARAIRWHRYSVIEHL